MSKQPVYISDIKNYIKSLGIYFSYDEITDTIEIEGNIPGVPKNKLLDYVKKDLFDNLKRIKNLQVTRADINDAIYNISLQNHYNSVTEMIENTKWDGHYRLMDVVEMLGIERDKLSVKLFRKWLIQTVAMAYNDEDRPYGSEGILTFQGPQGVGKTSFFRKLAIKDDWFCEGLSLNLDNKDRVIRATRAWITELGELDSTIERKQSQLKGFITKPTDNIRSPYTAISSKRPRRTSFCATVNPQRFLRDETGNRRFWIIPVKNIDKKALNGWTAGAFMQFWREIYQEHYLKDPQGFRLTDDEIAEVEKRNLEYYKVSQVVLDVEALFDWSSTDWDYYRASEVWSHFSELKNNYKDNQIGRALTYLSEHRDYGITTIAPGNKKSYKLPRFK